MHHIYKTAILMVSTLTITGCASLEDDLKEAVTKTTKKQKFTPEEYQNKKRATNFWVGQHKDQLVTVKGPPLQIINTSRLGGKAAEAYLFDPGGPRAKGEGSSECHIDAYVVDAKSGDITDYYCR